MICWYWILKLKARFLSGDYAEALAAAEKAKPLLWAAAAQIQLLDYFYYAALTVAALYEKASADEQQAWRELLTAHQEQLREWAENYPPTFADKHALVSAEIARIEGRDADAMRLYEQAIRSAREQRFRAERGRWPTSWPRGSMRREASRRSRTHYLRDARYCYLHWGAHGKVSNSTSATRTCRMRERRPPAPPQLARRRTAGRRDGGQGFAGRVGRDCPRELDQNTDGDSGRACGR